MSMTKAGEMRWDELGALFPELGDMGGWLPGLVRHAQMLEAARVQVRATAVEGEAMVRRHYAESLELGRLVAERGGGARESLVVDVGSGGGFPGIVLAMVWPGARMVLVEAQRKRARLLQEMVEGLELANVEVRAERAEETGRGDLRDAAGLVVARAVAPLAELLEYTAPLACVGALIALPKGSRVEAEVAVAGPALAALHCRIEETVAMRPAISGAGRVVLVRKTGRTPEGYPRRAGVAGRRARQLLKG